MFDPWIVANAFATGFVADEMRSIQQAPSMNNAQLNAYLSGSFRNLQPKPKDCEGCGAPLKTYIHHCEYCRRAA